MKKNSRKTKKKLPQIKKDIKDFLLSEEGKISKKNIAKLGISLAILGMTLQPNNAHAAHTSRFYDQSQGGHNSNHANHPNHNSGGWC